jgi:hypothetical protein
LLAGVSTKVLSGDLLVQITGIGPTDTRYVNPTDTPKGSECR